MKTTTATNSSMSISANSTGYLNLGSVTAVSGREAVGLVVDVGSMSNYNNLICSTINISGTNMFCRIHNMGSSASSGSVSATVYWATVE